MGSSNAKGAMRSLFGRPAGYTPLPTDETPIAREKQDVARRDHARRALKVFATALVLALLGYQAVASLYAASPLP